MHRGALSGITAWRLFPPPHVIPPWPLAVLQRPSPLLGCCVSHGDYPVETAPTAMPTLPAFPFCLLGPPGVRTSMVVPPAKSPDGSSTSGDPFIDLMTASFNVTPPPLPLPLPPPLPPPPHYWPPRGLTENSSPTFLTSGNSCLDFFFQVVPDTPPCRVVELLQPAWEQDPLKALKLVCNLRGVRGTGKSDREGFYTAALWLHEHHPKTLALNARWFPAFGYFKDLLEILYRLVHGSDVRQKEKQKYQEYLMRKTCGRYYYKMSNKARRPKEGERQAAEGPEAEVVETGAVEKQPCTMSKRSREEFELATKVVRRYDEDEAYRFLHDQVSLVFAERLASDLEQLRSGSLRRIGLAAKWCPSLRSSFDRSTLMCESVARRLFPPDSDPMYEGVEEGHYVYSVRNRFRKEALVPLRKALHLPEVYMAAKQWNVLPYNRVASVAMKRYTELFMKYDATRFTEFLNRVKKGEAKIAAGALLPHEILAKAAQGEEDEVAELQWQRMVKDMADRGKLRNCITVCDVSGSMTGRPMDVCVALGLLISELSEVPWKGKVITFSANPELHTVNGETLLEKTEFIREMDWGMNTDFQRVFDRILSVAVQGKLEEDKMIKRVFVFSDMEFDEASGHKRHLYDGFTGHDSCGWDTDYGVICSKFKESGYGNVIPEIVFWNLRNSRSTPVPSGQKGVALVSGFSKNLMKVFMEEDGALDPVAVMDAAISSGEYANLAVFD